MAYFLLGGPQESNVRNIKALIERENQHFQDILCNNMSLDSSLIGVINPQILSNKKLCKKNLDLIKIMQELRFDHVKLTGTDWN